MVKKMISEYCCKTEREKRIEFDLVGDKGSRFSFHTEDGVTPIFDTEYAESQKQSYEMCLNNPDYEGPILRHYNWIVTENAKAICECGEEIELWNQYLGACQCSRCGIWHNLFGQTLTEPEYWDE